MEAWRKTKSRKVRPLLGFAAIAFLIGVVAISCEDFLEVPPPKSMVTDAVVFNDEATAEAAMLGVYHRMYSGQNFAGGANGGIMTFAGLSSDELVHYQRTDEYTLQFQENSLTAENPLLLTLWNSLYGTAFQSNAILEGLANSRNIPSRTRDQLTGEALFVRAFCHFYLTGLFGDVPIVTSTDYRVNANLPRTATATVYSRVMSDLEEAIPLMRESYVGPERIRPNAYSAMALLARTKLYVGHWEDAALYATRVIEQSQYKLADDLDDVFLGTSEEAIWQIKPPGPNASYTTEGWVFNTTNGPRYNVLDPAFVQIFAQEDRRLANWIRAHAFNSEIIYLPYKYKVSTPGVLTEYSMVLRLAEQFLIRAEARLAQGDLAGALADLNMVRHRAGLGTFQSSDQSSVLNEIMLERKRELFTEWGHRWLDLKRTKLAASVLQQKELGFDTHDEYYPIPQMELNKNSALVQNPGY